MSAASINKKVKEAINQKGQIYTIDIVSQMFKEIDAKHKGSVLDTDEEFDKLLLAMGVTLNAREKRTFLKNTLKVEDDTVSLSSFLSFLLPEIPKTRKKVVDEGFKRLNPDGDETINKETLTKRFGNNSDEKYTTIGGRRVLISKIVNEILEMFDFNDDGEFTEADFLNYYKELSSSFDDDDFFNSMIKASWELYKRFKNR